MNTEEKAKAYDEALKKAQCWLNDPQTIEDCGYTVEDAIQNIFPELRESEEERIRKWLVDYFKEVGKTWIHQDITCEQILAWLEKQKECLADNSETSADDGERIRKGMLRHFRNKTKPYWNEIAVKDIIAYLEGQKPTSFNEPYNPDDYEVIMGENTTSLKQKEQKTHYTKRNALFDECVKNCDPKTVEEVNKRVDDIMNMPRLSPFEQALTNFIGDWEDDEEHWPSQFVKKHGKHILDIAREELQKEQKSSSKFCSGDWVVYDGPLGHAILQVKDVVDGRYTFVDNVSTLLVEDSDKFLRPLTPKDVEKPAEWSEEDKDMLNSCISSIEEAKENRYAYKETDGDTSYDHEIAWLKSLRCHWRPNDEDEVRLINTSISFLKDFADKGYENAVECIDWLKSKLNGNTCE